MAKQVIDIQIDPKKLKSARGLRSARETAQQLGISYQYLNMIENGHRDVPSEVLVRMCAMYGVNNIFDLTNKNQKILARG